MSDQVIVVLVTGSREADLYDNHLVCDVLDDFLGIATECGLRLVVRHGDCPRGIDRYARSWCVLMDAVVEEQRYPADWNTHGKRAGFLRNSEMVASGADVCIAFPRGKSSGTRHCMREAEKAGIPVYEF